MFMDLKQLSADEYIQRFHDATFGCITISSYDEKIVSLSTHILPILGYAHSSALLGQDFSHLWWDRHAYQDFMNEIYHKNEITPHHTYLVNASHKRINTLIGGSQNQASGYIDLILVLLPENIKNEKQPVSTSTLIESIPEIIALFDQDKGLFYIRQEAQVLFPIKLGDKMNTDLLQSTFFFTEKTSQDIMYAIEQGQTWQQDMDYEVHNTQKHCIIRVIPIQNHDLGYIYMVFCCDISDVVTKREEADSANITKTQFLANMSHEIRTPMIGILGAVNLLELQAEHLSLPELENIAIIRECGEHLLNILNDIIDVSKIELGMYRVEPELCQIKDIFNQAVTMLEPLVREKEIFLDLDMTGNAYTLVKTDPIKLQQITVNLLYNAIKFTFPQGTIRLKVWSEWNPTYEPLLYVAISDNGIGIPLEKQSEIFQAFVQGDNSASREFGGTGLGLFICHKLVELMGGAITLQSTLNEGSTFTFHVPVELSEEELIPEPSMDWSHTNPLVLDLNPIKVLLVEDNPLNARVISQMLSSFGFEVYRADNGLEGIRVLYNQSFQLILMDMQMPVMDGYEATKLIRSDPVLSNIPIIAMTAHALTGDREKCLAYGCSSYIAKPFDRNDLFTEIKKYLDAEKNLSMPDISGNQDVCSDQLRLEFYSYLDETVLNLNNALEAQDISQVMSISHDIKGTAGLYGFQQISALAAQIEQAAREPARQRINHLVLSLRAVSKNLNRRVS